ncbi:MAG: SMC-Scp complex subunit ScpB [Acidobacteriia bacterium]|nr:SMC-Scp complex subunit ScpB [Terriglobia bacterium]
MAIKGQLEAIIYAAEEPVTVEQIALVLKDSVIAENALGDAGLEGSAVDAEVKRRVRAAIEELISDYAQSDRGIEVREVAGGYRMGTKPEHHDIVRHFAKNLKPPMRLSLPALETLAVIAYKQPVTAPEISEIRGVDTSGVLATLLDRKLITTAGRKQVIGRPILYKTSKEFLLRFGLKDVGELPSLEEFEKLAGEGQADLFQPAAPAEPGADVATGEEKPTAAGEQEPMPDPLEPADNVQVEPHTESSGAPPQSSAAPAAPEVES